MSADEVVVVQPLLTEQAAAVPPAACNKTHNSTGNATKGKKKGDRCVKFPDQEVEIIGYGGEECFYSDDETDDSTTTGGDDEDDDVDENCGKLNDEERKVSCD